MYTRRSIKGFASEAWFPACRGAGLLSVCVRFSIEGGVAGADLFNAVGRAILRLTAFALDLPSQHRPSVIDPRSMRIQTITFNTDPSGCRNQVARRHSVLQSHNNTSNTHPTTCLPAPAGWECNCTLQISNLAVYYFHDVDC